MISFTIIDSGDIRGDSQRLLALSYYFQHTPLNKVGALQMKFMEPGKVSEIADFADSHIVRFSEASLQHPAYIIQSVLTSRGYIQHVTPSQF